jgi:hypothetical protein
MQLTQGELGLPHRHPGESRGPEGRKRLDSDFYPPLADLPE